MVVDVVEVGVGVAVAVGEMVAVEGVVDTPAAAVVVAAHASTAAVERGGGFGGARFDLLPRNERDNLPI